MKLVSKALLAALAAALLVLAAVPAGAQDARATFSINTTKMIMPMPPGVPAGLLGGITAPHRQVTMLVDSPGAAPDNATATLDLPSGLKLGNTVDLSIMRPKPTPGGTPANAQVNVVLYWGCGDMVQAGQPTRVNLNDQLRTLLQRVSPGAGGVGSTTLAMYPGGMQTGRRPGGSGILAGDASAVGAYALHTSYTGNVDFTVAPEQDFLAPVDVTAPTGDGTPDLTRSITVSWKQVPHALGYRVMAVSMKKAEGGVREMVVWTAGTISPFAGNQGDYTDAAQAVRDGVLLAPDDTTCTIPANILAGGQMATLMVEAVGPVRSIGGQPKLHVSTSSMTTVMLSALFGGGGLLGGTRPPMGE